MGTKIEIELTVEDPNEEPLPLYGLAVTFDGDQIDTLAIAHPSPKGEVLVDEHGPGEFEAVMALETFLATHDPGVIVTSSGSTGLVGRVVERAREWGFAAHTKVVEDQGRAMVRWFAHKHLDVHPFLDAGTAVDGFVARGGDLAGRTGVAAEAVAVRDVAVRLGDAAYANVDPVKLAEPGEIDPDDLVDPDLPV